MSSNLLAHDLSYVVTFDTFGTRLLLNQRVFGAFYFDRLLVWM